MGWCGSTWEGMKIGCGSAQNRQPWEFVVVSDATALAQAVYVPDNLLTAALVVAILGRAGIDVGRAAQNMMLTAWDEGIASCPNGIADPAAAETLLGGEPAVILSFGYPVRPRDPAARSAGEWSERANRRPLDEIVRHM